MAATGLVPLPPVTPPPLAGSLYAYMAPFASTLIGYARTTVLRIIRESVVRPDPSRPPSVTGNVTDECIAYVSGYRPRRTDREEIAAAAQYKAIIDSATIDDPPRLGDLIDFNGERYVILEVKRAPAGGEAVVFWKVLFGRGA